MANQAVYGIIGNRAKAEQIIQALVDIGVNSKDISILSSQGKEFSEFTSTTQPRSNANDRNWRNEQRVTDDNVTDYPAGTRPEERYRNTNTTNTTTNTTNPNFSSNRTTNTNTNASHQGGLAAEKHTKAPEGAATGATTGGIIGGTLGLLAGIGALAIPGVGPFVAAGPIMAALSGLGIGGALGTVVGGLIGLGIPEYEAKRYENRVKEGGILIAVLAKSDDLAKRVKELLQQHGAEDVSISSEASSSKNYNK